MIGQWHGTSISTSWTLPKVSAQLFYCSIVVELDVDDRSEDDYYGRSVDDEVPISPSCGHHSTCLLSLINRFQLNSSIIDRVMPLLHLDRLN